MERHDDIQALLTDYALGELSPTDREPVDAHLATCPECARDARELVHAFQGIGLAEPPVAPPPHVRSRVLEHLAREARASTQAGTVTPIHTAEPWWRSNPAWLGLAAAAVLVCGGLLAMEMQSHARLTERLGRADQEVARLARQMAETAGQADLAISILTATDMRRIDLAGFDVSRDAIARAYWSATKGLLIVADRLPQPPPGRTYQVWLIGGGSSGPVSAGLIEGQRSTRGMLIAPPPGGVTGNTVTVAVTDEPAGGLPAPTGTKHLVGSI